MTPTINYFNSVLIRFIAWKSVLQEWRDGGY